MIRLAFSLALAIFLFHLGSTQAQYMYPDVDLLAGKSTMACIFALHRTSSTYSGPTIRVRRSSDNTAQDFFADLDGDMFSALNGAGTPLSTWLGGSTAFVTTWYDQTGNGRHATQSTTTLQPTYNVAAKTVNFDATDDFMNVNLNCVNYGNSAYTIVSRHGSIGNTANGGLYGFGAGGTGQSVSCRAVSSSQYRVSFGLNTVFDFSNGGSHSERVITISYATNRQLTYAVNGAGGSTTLSFTRNGVNNGEAYIGKTTHTNGDYLIKGSLRFLYFSTSILSGADRRILEGLDVPTVMPSVAPTISPTCVPTTSPTIVPSMIPTLTPTHVPTATPSLMPSMTPTTVPSLLPTEQPTVAPTALPTVQPTIQPTVQPTVQPSRCPTGQPTGTPSTQPSRQPTNHPTAQPSSQPSSQPSEQPTTQPSTQPSSQPSEQPTSKPSSQPSNRPSSQPSFQPSAQPSTRPSSVPSDQPTSQPSVIPSGQPTSQPSFIPSSQPTSQPSGIPTGQPSSQPSGIPTSQPTSQPSLIPTSQPTGQPTAVPSGPPTAQPSIQPSRQPTAQPSMQPSRQPTTFPSSCPSSQPSSSPSSLPTNTPTNRPSSIPTCQPTAQPSSCPSSIPSRSPTSQPSASPSSAPSRTPTSRPSSQPSHQPTSSPFANPSERPTRQPSRRSLTSHQPTIGTSCPSAPLNTPTVQPNNNQLTISPSRKPSVSPTPVVSRLSKASGNASQAIGMLISLYEEANNTGSSLVTDDVRMVAQTYALAQGASVTVAMPLTDEEQALVEAGVLKLPSLQFSSNTSGNASVTVAAAVLSSALWTPPSQNNSALKPPAGKLQSDIVTVLTSGNASKNYLDIRFPPGTTAGYNATTPIRFTITCPSRLVVQKTYKCNDTGYVEYVQCQGIAGVYKGTCPLLQETCASLDLTNMVATSNNLCQTIRSNTSISDEGFVCKCGLGPGLIPGTSSVTAGVVIGLVSSDLSKTFQASSAFSDGSAASKATIVLSLFSCIWGLALAGMLIYGVVWRKYAVINEQQAANTEAGASSSDVTKSSRIEEILDSYLTALFPAAFFAPSILDGLVREVWREHYYINFFLRLHESQAPVLDVLKMATIQSYLLFLLALLYDLNFPNDDGSCINHQTAVDCLQRKYIFDPSQSYCAWQEMTFTVTEDDGVFFECVYANPQFSYTTAMYVSMMLSLAVCLLMDPLEFVFSLLKSPSLADSHEEVQRGNFDRKSKKKVDPKVARAILALEAVLKGSGETERPVEAVQPPPTPGSSRPTSSPFSLPYRFTPAVAKEAAICLQSLIVRKGETPSASTPLPILDIEVLYDKLLRYRQILLTFQPEYVSQWDAAWCIDASSGFFISVKQTPSLTHSSKIMTTSRSRRGAINNNARVSPCKPVVSKSDLYTNAVPIAIQRELLGVRTAADVISDELLLQADAERGFEILVTFVRDVLGRNSAAAHIYALKMELEYETTRRVRMWVKVCIVLFLVSLNGFFFYFTLLRGISKGPSWQRSYLIAWALQTSLDVFVFETLQCAWFHYFVPSLVKKEVSAAKQEVQQVMEAFLVDPHMSTATSASCHKSQGMPEKSQFNAAEFLFVSFQLSHTFPELLESYLVKSYYTVFPGKMGVAWQQIAASSVTGKLAVKPEKYSITSASALLYPLRMCGKLVIAALLRSIILLPLEVQSLVIRVLEPAMFSGVIFFILMLSDKPLYLATLCGVLVVGVVSLLLDHWNAVRRTKRTHDSTMRQQQSSPHARFESKVDFDAAAAIMAVVGNENIVENSKRNVLVPENRSNFSSKDNSLLDLSFISGVSSVFSSPTSAPSSRKHFSGSVSHSVSRRRPSRDLEAGVSGILLDMSPPSMRRKSLGRSPSNTFSKHTGRRMSRSNSYTSHDGSRRNSRNNSLASVDSNLLSSESDLSIFSDLDDISEFSMDSSSGRDSSTKSGV